MIKENKKYKTIDLLEIAQIKKSTYYDIIKRENKDKYEEIKNKILNIYFKNKGLLGYRRIYGQLIKEDININEKTVLKLMNELKIRAIRSNKKSKYNSYPGEKGNIKENILDRNFKAENPYEKLVTDVTELKFEDEKIYFSPMIDLYNQEVISYKISESATIEVIKEMVEDGMKKISKEAHPVLHSDRGCQYRSMSYQKFLINKGIIQSMSKKGTCADNAMAENFFSIMKNEFYYVNKFKSKKELIKGLKEYIEYYNNKRIKEKLNWMSPIEYRTTAS